MGILKNPLRFLMSSPLFRQAGIYGISHLAAKAIPFLLLPIITRYLTREHYGIVAMFMLLVALVQPFVGLGLNGATTVKYYDDKIDLGDYLSTGFGVVVLAAIPAGALLFLLREPLSRVTAVPPEWISIVIFLVLASSAWSVVMALWRVQNRAVTYGIFQNLQSAAIVGGTLILVVGLRREWQGRVEAELIAFGISGLIAVVYLRKAGLLRFVFVRDYAKNFLRFGVPLIPHLLGGVLIAQTDRLFITNFVGVDETGVFTVGYQLALLISLAAVSFNNAYSPWLFQKLKTADEAMKVKLVRYTYVHFAGIACFAFLVAVVMPPLAGWILDPSYARAGIYVGWFAIAFACTGMYYIVSNYLFYAEKTGWLATATLATAALNIPLNYFFIKANGAVGAAQATAVAWVLNFLFTWSAAARVFPMPWGHPFRRRPSAD